MFWRWWSQVKCPFETFYYWWVLRDVLMFNSKNMCHHKFWKDQSTVRYSLVEEFSEKVAQLYGYHKLCCSLDSILSHVSDKTDICSMLAYVVGHWWCLALVVLWSLKPLSLFFMVVVTSGLAVAVACLVLISKGFSNFFKLFEFL